MLLVSTRWPSCFKSCKQPISRTDVLTKGVVEISTCSGGCAWNSEVPLVDSIKITDGDLAQWEMKVGSNSFLFLNLNNSSFQKVMLGFVCSGMIWKFGRPKVARCVFVFVASYLWAIRDRIRNSDEWKLKTHVNSGDIHIMITSCTHTYIYIFRNRSIYIYIYNLYIYIDNIYIHIFF